MIRNSRDSWGWPTRALHWIVAVAVIALFVHGLWMEELGRDQRGLQIWLHSAIGISLLGLAAEPCAGRVVTAAPAGQPGTRHGQRHAESRVHAGLYRLIFAVTLSGWLLTGAMRVPIDVDLFGVISAPPPVSFGPGYHEVFEEAHEIFANVLIALASVHAAAALYYHFVLRDAVLWRMLGPKPKHEP